MENTKCNPWRWVPVVVYAAFVFYLSSLSHPKVPHFSYSDKIYHLCLYAGWGFVILITVWPRPRACPLKHWKKVLAVASLGALVYGVTDEIHQLFVLHRSFELWDLVADTVGGFLGGCFYLLMRWAYESRNQSSSC